MSNISTSANLSELLEGEQRLDATYYTSLVYRVRKALDDFQEEGGEITTIGDASQGTYNPPPIKRIYTDDAALGDPYMLPQEMFDFYWEPKKFVLAEKMHNIDEWYLKRNWLVLTQSGTVGKPYLATEGDEDVVLSQNAIRIPLEDEAFAGYLYAYLSTWLGQTMLKKDEFGITVKHIRPHHVDAIKVPMADEETREWIGQRVQRAFKLRQEAIRLIKEAKAAVCDALGVPYSAPVEEDEQENDQAEISNAKQASMPIEDSVSDTALENDRLRSAKSAKTAVPRKKSTRNKTKPQARRKTRKRNK